MSKTLWIPFMVNLSYKPFVVSLSNHAFRGKAGLLLLKFLAKSVVRQAHHERDYLIQRFPI